MHRIATALSLVIGLTATTATIAQAQVYGYGYGVPSGSYQRSCSNEGMRGNVLTAACSNNNGQMVWSSLDVTRCSGDIANVNGRLSCGGYTGGYNNGGYGYNNGGYGRDRDDENDDDDNGNRHHRGTHRDHGRGNGGYNNGRGNGDDDNNNGAYNGGYNNGGYNNGGYNNGGYGYGLPPGTWQQSCQNARMNGSILSAVCTAVNGAWINSSLDLRRCYQGRDVYNRNGYLGC